MNSLFHELYLDPHSTMRYSILFYHNSIGEIALGFIPRTGPFLWNVFQHAHRPDHLSVKPVGQYQKESSPGNIWSILFEQFQPWSASVRSFLVPFNLFFCLYSCGIMTSRKKVLLKVIILGDSGWVMLSHSLKAKGGGTTIRSEAWWFIVKKTLNYSIYLVWW